MRSTAATGGGGRGCKRGAGPSCWRSRGRTRAGRTPRTARATSSPRGWRRRSPSSPSGWQRLSAGDGATGPRREDWTWVPLRPLADRRWGCGWLVAGGGCGAAAAPPPTWRPTSAWRRPRRRWQRWCAWQAPAGRSRNVATVPRGKGEGGGLGPRCGAALDELGSAAHARPAGARLPPCHPRRRGRAGAGARARGDVLPVSVPAVRRLLWRLVWAVVPPSPLTRPWSMWRRRHHARPPRSFPTAAGPCP